MILSSISSGAFVKPKTTKNDHRLGHGYGFGNRRTLSSIEKREALIFAANSEKNIVSGSDLLGPGSYALEADDSRSPSEAISAVELKTERDIDFTRLKQLLIDGDFKQADDEARSILLKCAGESAQARGWIYFTEVATIPSSDMKTIDDLWIASSQGKFGYSVQRKVHFPIWETALKEFVGFSSVLSKMDKILQGH